jgi:hypothetical protein
MPWPVGFVRAIIFLQTPEGEGFSEEYLADEADVPNPSVWAGGIATQRLLLLSNLYSLTWVRLNRPHDARTLLPYTASPPFGAPGTFTTGTDFQRSEVGGLVKFYTSSGRYSNRIFRGTHDPAMNTDGTLNDAADWTVQLGIFVTYLVSTAKVGLINTVARPTHPAYTFEKYQSSAVLRSSTRDTGRPFGLRRGRSAA